MSFSEVTWLRYSSFLVFIYIYLFILKSTLEGPEGTYNVRGVRKMHKYTAYGNVQKRKTNKQKLR